MERLVLVEVALGEGRELVGDLLVVPGLGMERELCDIHARQATPGAYPADAVRRWLHVSAITRRSWPRSRTPRRGCSRRPPTMTDDEARQPSRLPGWTRGHVMTHLARNADGLRNLAEGAIAGEERAMYPSAEQREADIEAGSGRPAAELHTDIERGARRAGRDVGAPLDRRVGATGLVARVREQPGARDSRMATARAPRAPRRPGRRRDAGRPPERLPGGGRGLVARAAPARDLARRSLVNGALTSRADQRSRAAMPAAAPPIATKPPNSAECRRGAHLDAMLRPRLGSTEPRTGSCGGRLVARRVRPRP